MLGSLGATVPPSPRTDIGRRTPEFTRTAGSPRRGRQVRPVPRERAGAFVEQRGQRLGGKRTGEEEALPVLARQVLQRAHLLLLLDPLGDQLQVQGVPELAD